MLDQELDDALAREARAARISKSELARRYLREKLQDLPPLESDPLWEFVGGSDAEPAAVDDILYPR